MLNVEKDFKGMPILATDTGAKLGEIRDALIHPVEGLVMGGVAVTADGDERRLRVSDFVVGQDAVMMSQKSFRYAGDYANEMEGGIRAIGEMIGSTVVTEDGKLLGRISEVYIGADRPQVVYRVAESTLQKFFGGGFFIDGNVAISYAPDGARIIVPAETEDRYAASSLSEFF
jgi:uncharacterized protein YrrD